MEVAPEVPGFARPAERGVGTRWFATAASATGPASRRSRTSRPAPSLRRGCFATGIARSMPAASPRTRPTAR
eukprot:4401842-Alexandrium_andersonii.AAC.1